MMSSMSDDGPPVDLMDINWPCDGCQEFKQKLAKTQAEHTSNYTTLKQKIISTDLLIKKFKTKCDKFDIQSKILEETKRKLENTQRDSETLEKQLNVSLEQLEPLKTANAVLMSEESKQCQEISDLKDKLKAAEQLQSQYKQLMLESNQNKQQNEANQKHRHSMENSTKKQEATVIKLKGELSKKKSKLSEMKRRNKKLESDHTKVSAKLEMYLQILHRHGLLPRGERLPVGAAGPTSPFHQASVDYDVFEMDECPPEMEGEMAHSFIPKVISEDELDEVVMETGGFMEIKMSDIFSDVLRLSTMTPLSPLAPSTSGSDQGNEGSSGAECCEEDEEELSKLAGLLEREMFQPVQLVNGERVAEDGNNELTGSLEDASVETELTLISQESTSQNNSAFVINKRSEVKSLEKTKENPTANDTLGHCKVQDVQKTSNYPNLDNLSALVTADSPIQNSFEEAKVEERDLKSFQKAIKMKHMFRDHAGSTLARRLSPLRNLCLPSLLEDEVIENSIESRGVPFPTDPEHLSDTNSNREDNDHTLEAAKKVTRQSTTEFVVSKDLDIESLDGNSTDQDTTTATTQNDSVFTPTVTNSQDKTDKTPSPDLNSKTDYVNVNHLISNENDNSRDIPSCQNNHNKDVLRVETEQTVQEKANGFVISQTNNENRIDTENKIADVTSESASTSRTVLSGESLKEETESINDKTPNTYNEKRENCTQVQLASTEQLSDNLSELDNSAAPTTTKPTKNGFNVNKGKDKTDENITNFKELTENLDQTFTAREICEMSDVLGIAAKRRSKRCASDPVRISPKRCASDPVRISPRSLRSGSGADTVSPANKGTREQLEPTLTRALSVDPGNLDAKTIDEQESTSPKIKRRRSSSKFLRRSPRLSSATINKDPNIDIGNEKVNSCDTSCLSPLPSVNLNNGQSTLPMDKEGCDIKDEQFAEDAVHVKRRLTRALTRQASKGLNGSSVRQSSSARNELITFEPEVSSVSKNKTSLNVKSDKNDSKCVETKKVSLGGFECSQDTGIEFSSEIRGAIANEAENRESVADGNPSAAPIDIDLFSNVIQESSTTNSPVSPLLTPKCKELTVNTDENKNLSLCQASGITSEEKTISLNEDKICSASTILKEGVFRSANQTVKAEIQCAERSSDTNQLGNSNHDKGVEEKLEAEPKAVVAESNPLEISSNTQEEGSTSSSNVPIVKMDTEEVATKSDTIKDQNKTTRRTNVSEQEMSPLNFKAGIKATEQNDLDELPSNEMKSERHAEPSVEEQNNDEVCVQIQNINKNQTSNIGVKQPTERSSSEPKTGTLNRLSQNSPRKAPCSLETEQSNSEHQEKDVPVNLEDNQSNVQVNDGDGELDIPSEGQIENQNDPVIGGDIPSEGEIENQNDPVIGGDIPSEGEIENQNDPVIGGDIPSEGEIENQNDPVIGGDIPSEGEIENQNDPVIGDEPQAGPSRPGSEQPRPKSLTLSSTFVPIYIPCTSSSVPSVIRQSTSSIAVVSPQTSGPVVGSYISASMSRSVTPSSGCSISASSPVSPLPPSPFEYMNIIPISPLPPSPAPAEPLSPLPSSPSSEEDPSNDTVVEVDINETPDSQEPSFSDQNIEDENIVAEQNTNSPFRIPSIISLQPTPLPLPLTPLPSTPLETVTAVTPDLQAVKSLGIKDPNSSLSTAGSTDGERPSTSRHISGNEGHSRRNLEQSFSKVSLPSGKSSAVSTVSDQTNHEDHDEDANRKANCVSTIIENDGCVSSLRAKKRISHCKSDSQIPEQATVASLKRKFIEGPKTTNAAAKISNRCKSGEIKSTDSVSPTSKPAGHKVLTQLQTNHTKSSAVVGPKTQNAAAKINTKRKSNEISSVEMSAAGDTSASKKLRQANKEQGAGAVTNQPAYPGGDCQPDQANNRKLSHHSPSPQTETLPRESNSYVSLKDLPAEYVKEISHELEGYLRVSGADPSPVLEKILVGKSPEEVLQVLILEITKTGASCTITHMIELLPAVNVDITLQDPPFISEKETQIITLLCQFLEHVKQHNQVDLTYQLMSSLWREIFKPDTEGLNGVVAVRLKTHLCRIFAALCRLQGDLEQCRVFIYHVLRCPYLSYPVICLAVSCVWPTALRKTTTGDPSPLLQVVEFLIMKTLSSGKSKHEMMLKAFQRLCLWETSIYHSSLPVHEKLQSQLDELVNSTPPLNHTYVFEFFKTYELLLIKDDWGKIMEAINTIFPYIGKLVSKEEDVLMHSLIPPILQMFGSLLGRFEVVQKKKGDVKQIIIHVIHYLLTVKLDIKVPMAIQEEAVQLLLRLSPFCVNEVADRLRIWLPKHIDRISHNLKIQLINFSHFYPLRCPKLKSLIQSVSL